MSKQTSLAIDFKFESLIDSLAFEDWKASHPDASTEQIIAHAKANGCKEAELGDGTVWKLA